MKTSVSNGALYLMAAQADMGGFGPAYFSGVVRKGAGA